MRWWGQQTGGRLGMGLIAGAQFVVAVLFIVDPRLCLALVGGVAAVLTVLRWPLIGVALLIAARVLSTGALVFMRVGSIGIGPFEPALALCLVGLLLHALIQREPLWQGWAWRAPYLALMGWVALSAAWAQSRGEAIGDLLPMGLVVANVLVILRYVRSWEAFRLMLWAWVGACVLVGVLSLGTEALGIQVTTVTFKAASGGGRETGLGQQPNWFAMNLMFIIHSCFGLALLERHRVVRLGFGLAGVFVFFMMLKSGSRGGAYATLIGALLAALAHPTFRRWFGRFSAITAVIFALGIAFDIGDSAKALTRIGSNLALQQNYRELNWIVCLEMFRDTWGRGIGAGGYEDLLPTYNNYLVQSLYDYPHGILWEVIAHYGAPGLLICAWLIWAIVSMSRNTIRLTQGSPANIFAWTMPAALLGYFAWSFVEFTLNEKPVWEFLALLTALQAIAHGAAARGETLGHWEGNWPRLPRLELRP
jgi:hypothetical protein